MKLKVLAIMTGISAKSGKRYTKITLRGKKQDGTTSMADFWLNEKVGNQLTLDGVQEDDYVSVELDLDENLRPVVAGIFKEEVTD